MVRERRALPFVLTPERTYSSRISAYDRSARLLATLRFERFLRPGLTAWPLLQCREVGETGAGASADDDGDNRCNEKSHGLPR